MHNSTPEPPRLALDLYQRSRHEMFTLKSQMPEASVIGLAREVLRRIEARGVKTRSSTADPSAEDIDSLCYALISDDEQEGTNFIEALRADGASLETLYLSYLAAAARTLGNWWNEDDASFAEVALGTSRIYGIIRGLSHILTTGNPSEFRTAVFASAPGETHTFGVRMAADLFRKEGWEIDLKVGLHHNQLVDEIESANPKVIGISCAGAHAVDALAHLVVALRITCPGSAIVLSGQIVNEAREVVDLMGADAVVTSVPEAKSTMSGLWDSANDQPL